MNSDQPTLSTAPQITVADKESLSPAELRMQYTEAEILDLLTLREQLGQREGASSGLNQQEISSLFRK